MNNIPLLSAFTGAPAVNKVYNVDALTLLRALPSNSVDLVIADPPYNVSKAGGRYGFKGKVFLANDWDTFETPQDYIDFSCAWMRECRRVLKDTGTMYVWGYHRSLPYLPIAEWYQLNLLVWHKTNAFPTTMHDSMWSPSCEFAYFLRKDAKRDHVMNISKDDFARDIFMRPTVTGGIHPSQKPLEIISEFVRRSSNAGDLVLDPFCGSGTTAVAARNLGRNYITCDTTAEYVCSAGKRLAQAYTPQMFPDSYAPVRQPEQLEASLS